MILGTLDLHRICDNHYIVALAVYGFRLPVEWKTNKLVGCGSSSVRPKALTIAQHGL
jgi:hypothetical protein